MISYHLSMKATEGVLLTDSYLKVHLYQLVRPLNKKRRANIKMKSREALLLSLKSSQHYVHTVYRQQVPPCKCPTSGLYS